MKTYQKIFALIMISCATALAEPETITHQGLLTSPSGTPLDTVVSVAFKLYNNVDSPTPFWSEIQSVTVTNGLYNIALGTITAFPEDFLNDGTTWLGITVGEDAEMLPRSKLRSVPFAFRVRTVDDASGGDIASDVLIRGKLTVGNFNTNTGTQAFVSGNQSTASGDYSTASGQQCTASGPYSTVCGGLNNLASGDFSNVGGGSVQEAGGNYSTISGGHFNNAAGLYSTISGGQYNFATVDHATVGGGKGNHAYAEYSTVSGGGYNYARGQLSVIAGGGGDEAADSNSAQGNLSVIGGGYHNYATGDAACIAGGYYHTASGGSATIGGGYRNTSTNSYSTVGGGTYNDATGQYATIPGGSHNTATGNYSFAAGRRAQANALGTFVWADATNADFIWPDPDSVWSNSFAARASGGVYLFTNSTLTAGVRLFGGGSSWYSVSDSTLKRNARLVDTKAILERVASMPIKQWSYKSQNPSIEHIGPMAQDFWNAFHVGDDSLAISTIDPSGVALAAIQELAKQNQEMKSEIMALRAQMQSQRAGDKQTELEAEK